MRSSSRRRQRGERTSSLCRDVDDRTERTRGEQRLAGADEGARTCSDIGDERAHQGALPDPRLSADEHEPPLTRVRTLEGRVQHVEGFLALEQSHGGHSSDDGEMENPRQGGVFL
jgi:hypothetical protein